MSPKDSRQTALNPRSAFAERRIIKKRVGERQEHIENDAGRRIEENKYDPRNASNASARMNG
jgi:hypothetical protein